MAIISIEKFLDTKSAIMHAEGVQIFNILYDYFVKNEKVQLSFLGLEDCTTAFLNASIGNLYLSFNQEVIKDLLTFEGLDNNLSLQSKIERVVRNSMTAQNRLESDNLIREIFAS